MIIRRKLNRGVFYLSDNAIFNKDKEVIDVYDKQDIMKIFKCESDKALKILKIMYQMHEANKIGREYYVSKDSLLQFLNDMKGKEIYL